MLFEKRYRYYFKLNASLRRRHYDIKGINIKNKELSYSHGTVVSIINFAVRVILRNAVELLFHTDEILLDGPDKDYMADALAIRNRRSVSCSF